MTQGETMRTGAVRIREVATDVRVLEQAAALDRSASRADAAGPGEAPCAEPCVHAACRQAREAVRVADVIMQVLDGVDAARVRSARDAVSAVDSRWPSGTPGDYPISAVRHAYISGYIDGAVAHGPAHGATAGAMSPEATADVVAGALAAVTGLRPDADGVREVAQRAALAILAKVGPSAGPVHPAPGSSAPDGSVPDRAGRVA